MNMEAYSYTVVTTVLGMLVVFLSLSGLSLLMVALKASFGERSGKSPGVGTRPSGRQGEGAASGRSAAERKPPENPKADGQRQPPPWLAAAVAAYLLGGEGEGPTAEPWLPEFNHFDPWLGAGRSTTQRSRGVEARE